MLRPQGRLARRDRAYLLLLWTESDQGLTIDRSVSTKWQHNRKNESRATDAADGATTAREWMDVTRCQSIDGI